MQNIIKSITDTASNMYRLGWNERNGGNISVRVDREKCAGYPVKRRLALTTAFPELAGECFLVSGTQKYFKNFAFSPEICLGLIRIGEGDSDDAKGSYAELLWGFEDGGRFTSEITMHLGTHLTRMKIDPEHRVVLHAHPANVIALTQLTEPDERAFTRALWEVMTECIVIFPDGVGLIDWALSSSDALGLETAAKFAEFRALVWAMHGITAVGHDLDDAFGLMETIEKAAQIRLKVMSASSQVRRFITRESLLAVAEGFNLKVREGWL